MEEEEKNEWGPRGQPSASEQLKISGYTEENKEEYVPKAIRAEQEKRQKAWDNPYFVEAYEIVQENPLNFKSILTQNQKNLLDYYGYDSYKDGDTDATGINAALTLGPFAAKAPAIASLLINNPGKAFTTVMQGVGAQDIINNPEDLAFETLGQKMDTLGNLTTLKPRGMLVTGKELAKKIDHWLGKDFDLFNPKGLFNRKQPITPEGVRIDANNIDLNPNIMQAKGGGGKSTQYRLLFNWEAQGAKPKANIGDTVDIVPRKVLRNKNWVTRKNIKFTKPDSIDLTNGFIPTKQHKNFSEFIEDLIEADRIPAQNITPQGFKAVSARSATPDLDLYEDYIAGYFNTHNTLDGITKVTLNNKTLRLGGKSLDQLKDVERVLKAYKLNPKAFTSGAFNPSSTTSKDIVEAFAQSKDIDDFILKNLKLQRHHIAILDDSFALVNGLTGNDLNRMYKIMDNEGLIVGNDARNLQLLPQEFHQGFIHGTIWPIAGPNWTGVSDTARLMRKNIAKLPVDQRVKYVQQLKDAIDEINLFMDDIIDTYIKEVKKGGQITLKDKASFMRYARHYMSKKGLLDTFDVDETIRSTSKYRRPNLEDQEFGQGRMQDDLQ